MDIEQLRAYCLGKRGAYEDFPFDETTLCFRVGGKIFAIVNLADERLSVNLKCEPQYALELRERYEEVRPGWHMNKKHWNTVDFEGRLSDVLLRQLIDHSYEQVMRTLSRAQRAALEEEDLL